MSELDKLTEEQSIIDGFAEVINKHSRENISDTADFIIGEYLYNCLLAYETIHQENQEWYGKGLKLAKGEQ